MITAAPVADLHARFAAEAKIVHAILAQQEPPKDALRVWLRGGAVFWNQDHLEICWGLHLRQAVTQEEIDSHGIRLAIEEADDLFRSRFGSISLRDLHGNEAVAVTAWNGFFGDRHIGFLRDIDQFRIAADADSWLLAKEHDMSDALADRTGDELLSLWCSEVSL
jgi:hypothetical protein